MIPKGTRKRDEKLFKKQSEESTSPEKIPAFKSKNSDSKVSWYTLYHIIILKS